MSALYRNAVVVGGLVLASWLMPGSQALADDMGQSEPMEIIAVQDAKEDVKEEGQLQEYEEMTTAYIADPLEPLNRVFFVINDKLYYWLLKPVSQGCGYVMPEMGRIAVRNFFTNLTVPIRLVNSILQGKMERTGIELERFGINTVLGGLGLVDVADKYFEIPAPPEEDLGQTFGAWGVGNGFYLVWPVLGPSSLRDSVGTVGDTFLDPLSYYPTELWTQVGVRAFKHVNNTSLRIGEYEGMVEDAIDPYLAIRDFYVQNRQDKIKE